MGVLLPVPTYILAQDYPFWGGGGSYSCTPWQSLSVVGLFQGSFLPSIRPLLCISVELLELRFPDPPPGVEDFYFYPSGSNAEALFVSGAKGFPTPPSGTDRFYFCSFLTCNTILGALAVRGLAVPDLSA